jgi:hypothetical protein
MWIGYMWLMTDSSGSGLVKTALELGFPQNLGNF